MLWIIIGHLGVFSGVWLYPIYILSLFHVAFFFFISGFFLNPERNLKDIISSKCKRLIKPYFIYGTLALIVYLIITPNLSENKLDKQLIDFLLGMRMKDSYIFTGALWFLTCLFITSIISVIILKLTFFWQCFTSILLLLFCQYNSYKDLIILPFNLDISCYMIPVMITAFHLRKNLTKITNKNLYKPKWSLLCIAVMCANLLILKILGIKPVNPFLNSFGIIPLTLICTITGIYITFHITSLITYSNQTRIKQSIKYIGQNSIIYLIIHQQFILHPLNQYGLIKSPNIINGVLRLGIVLIVCTLASFLINKKMAWSIK